MPIIDNLDTKDGAELAATAAVAHIAGKKLVIIIDICIEH